METSILPMWEVVRWLLAGVHLVMIAYYTYQLWVLRNTHSPQTRLKSDCTTSNLHALRLKMGATFNVDELHMLIFDLQLNSSIKRIGQNKPMLIVEIILYCQRMGAMEALMDYLRKQRPHIDW